MVCLGAKRWRDLGVLPRLVRELRGFRPVVLQTWLYHANTLGRLAGRLAHVPIIVSGIRVAERRSRLRLWADRFTERWVAAHVCVSRDVARFSIEQGGLDAARVHVISNGVDADRFANAQPADLSSVGIPNGAKLMLVVGRLDSQKDPLWLLEAFPKVQARVRNVHLAYAGRGPLQARLEEEIERRNLAGFVHVLGWRRDVPELLKTADVLVLPSRWEGLPNVVLEAFAAGTPVVATAVEGIAELIADGQTGLVVWSRDSDELAGRVVEILTNLALRSAVSASAQTLVCERFTWESNCEAYAGLYENLLANLSRK